MSGMLVFLILCGLVGLKTSEAVSQTVMKGLEAFCTGVKCLTNPSLSASWNFDMESGAYTAEACDFAGLRCDGDGNVIAVNLGQTQNPLFPSTPHIELSGTLASELFTNIQTLTEVNLRGNRLTGTIPVEMAALTALQVVDLGVNFLSGTIPMDLAHMKSLSNIDLSVNRLSGSIPKDMETLSSLASVKFHDNELVGSLPPATVESSTSLSALWLSDNMLTGALPTESTNLVEFKIANNALQGSVPKYGANLQYLDIAGNIGLDVAGSAENMAGIDRLSVTVEDCNFPDSIVNSERSTLHLSSHYVDESRECTFSYPPLEGGYCSYNTNCMLQGSTIATWGAVTSGKLKQLGLLSGFLLNFTEDAVAALVDPSKGNNQLTSLYLSATPHGNRFVHNSIYGGMLSAVEGCAWNVAPGSMLLPANIGDLSNLNVLVAAYVNVLRLVDEVTLLDNLWDLPESMKTMTNLTFLAIPNDRTWYVSNETAMKTASGFFDPHGVLPALSPSLYTLDIRGNRFNTSVSALFGDTTSTFDVKYLLLGDNLIEGNGLADTLLKMPKIEYFDISNNPTQESNFGDTKLNLFTHTPDLKYWMSSGTPLQGEFPAFPDSLRMMAAAGSRFTTGLGTTDFNLTHCITFSLARNNMTGTLPPANEFSYAMSYLFVKENLIEGTIAPEYTQLPNMHFLSLGFNRLSGDLPSFETDGLQILDVERNQLQGNIFTALSKLTSLYQLVASSNDIGAAWSDSLLSNTGLRKLDLSSTGMTGGVPTDLGTKLTSIEAVILGGNLLTGSVQNCGLQDLAEKPTQPGPKADPGGFFALDVYDNADLSSYGLCWYQYPATILRVGDSLEMSKGILPASQMDTLATIASAFDISTWDLSKDAEGNYKNNPCVNSTDYYQGRIACGANGDQWTITKVDLSVAWGNADKSFPSDLMSNLSAGLPDLLELDLSSNYFVGDIPSAGWPTTLETLDLGDNALSGSVPWDEILALPALKYLDVKKNQLEGEMPAAAFTSLVSLNAMNNRFEGSLPEVAAGTILPVSKLVVSGNLIEGTLPQSYLEAANCQSGLFQVLALNSNSLSGTLPAYLGSSCFAMSLKALVLDDNLFTGSIPSLNGLGSLVALTLQNNQFSGTLPFLYDMHSLVHLGIGLTKDQPMVPFENLPQGKNPISFALSTTEDELPPVCISKLSPLQALWFSGGFKGPVSETVMDSIIKSLASGLTLSFSTSTPDFSEVDYEVLESPGTVRHSGRNPNELSGELPQPSAALLSELVTLDTSGNDFTGYFPPAIAFFAPKIRMMIGCDNDYTILGSDLKDYNRLGDYTVRQSKFDISNNPRIGANGANYFDDSFRNTTFKSICAMNAGFSGPLSSADIIISTGGEGITTDVRLAGNEFSCYNDEFLVLNYLAGGYFDINSDAVEANATNLCNPSPTMAPSFAPTKPPSPKPPTPTPPPSPPPADTNTSAPSTGPTEAPTMASGTSSGNNNKLSEGAVIGISFGVFAFVVMVGLLAYLYMRNKSLVEQAQRASMRASMSEAQRQSISNPMAPPAPTGSGSPGRTSYGGSITAGITSRDMSAKEAPDAITEL